MVRDIERIKNLAKELMLLSSLGEVVTLQIDLEGISRSTSLLQDTFNDSEEIGLYVNSMILIRVMENKIYDYQDILDKIVEITGDYDCIDDVTALIRLDIGKGSVDITCSINGVYEMPNLLQSSKNTLYFQIQNLIHHKWLVAKNSMSNVAINRA